MGRLLPYRPESKPREGREPKLLDLTGEEADEVFDALASSTTRRILSLLYESPRPASDLAEEADTTLQNVRYHIEKLVDVGLIEEVDTWYSSTGNEMRVFAPTDTAVVMFMGEEPGGSIRQAITELAGGVGILALGALVLHQFLDPGAPDDVEPGLTLDAAEPTPVPDAPEESFAERAETPTPEAAAPGWLDGVVADLGAFLTEPAALFFLGGLTVLALVVALRYRRGTFPTP